MKIKILFISMVLILLLSGIGNAYTVVSGDGWARITCVNERGYYMNDGYGYPYGIHFATPNNKDYLKLTAYKGIINGSTTQLNIQTYGSGNNIYTVGNTPLHINGMMHVYYMKAYIYPTYGTSQSIMVYYSFPGDEYYGNTTSTISGNRYCPSLTILYILQGGSYQQIGESYASTYNFTIMEGYQYLIVFDAYNFYYFTADGTNLVRNYDNCEDQGDPGEPVDPDDPYNPNPSDTYIRLFFMDNCGNLLRNTSLQYCNHLEDTITCYFVDAPLGFYDLDFEDQDYLELWVDSDIGTLYYNISDPKCAGFLTYIILNPTISWNNNIIVVDGNTSLPIEDALVVFSQDCIINPLTYSSRNKFTDAGGFVFFDQCELDSFSLAVSATNYQSFFGAGISSASLNAFDLEQTLTVILYPLDDEENETEYIYTDYNTWVKFKDVDGNYTTTILDTDEYVDLYYYNNNSDGESMILKFQKYSIETGIIDLLSWNIPIDTDGYKRILKSNYTDTSYLYIGYLYNYAIDDWDRTEYLNILNHTTEIDLNYENLIAFLWFKNKNPEGSIDYREDIEIIAYANTTYVGLFNISLELYDNSSFITHINLTWADFISADLKYYYEWNPSHSYINGHNYTVRMHGYDYYLLDMDYVNATDYRKNKLTIIVKDRSGANLNNSFVFLEDYGSLSTGDSYYNSYEMLLNGNYRYKASKSGYSGTGWDEIILADGDEIVTYILISDTANTTYLPQKTSDEDIQAIFFPLMFALLIFILIGAFKYVCE